MSAEHLIPFPHECARYETCVQESRISVLEQRANSSTSQLSRIEDKLDFVRNWLMGALLTMLVALIGAIVVAVLKK